MKHWRLIVLLVVGGLFTSALAQSQGGSGGGATLSPGFLPDPFIISYVAGGSEPASQYGAECRGNVASEPDHILYLSAFDYLKVSVQSSSDTTLVIYGEPYNTWYCDDDTEGLNPVIAGSWLAGYYYIYVGSFDGNPSYNLVISELP
jgi:hypothetical protein